MKGTFTIVIEDEGMDSGCIHDILEECANHGKVLSAKIDGTTLQGEPYSNDVMHFFETCGIENSGQVVGKC